MSRTRKRFQDTIVKEVKEETNLDVNKEDLKLIDTVSDYLNLDVAINNIALYCIKNSS